MAICKGSYVKAFSAYFIGTTCYYVLAILIGVLIDSILK